MGRVLGILLAVFLVLVIIVQSVIIVFLILERSDGGALFSDSTVAVVRIDDVIIDSKTFIDRVDTYADDESVKAIVLRMETPGGAVAASQEVASAVERLRSENGKIVVTSVANLGASGGYYIATYSDAIVVNPGSLVGSIGVILQHFEMKELADRLGLKFESIVSGRMKDAGTITRPLAPEEREYFQSLIDNAYGQFRDAVLRTRWKALAVSAGVDESDSEAIAAHLAKVADGRVLTGAQALDAGLADRLGDLTDAIDLAAKLAGIEGEPNVVYHNPKDPWEELGKVFGLSRLFPVAAAPAILPSGLWYIHR